MSEQSGNKDTSSARERYAEPSSKPNNARSGWWLVLLQFVLAFFVIPIGAKVYEYVFHRLHSPSDTLSLATALAVAVIVLLLPSLIAPAASRRGVRIPRASFFVYAVILGVLVSLLVAPWLLIKVRDHPPDTGVKQNLHSIQLAIERYASDNDGIYPHYLLGGDWSDDYVISEEYWRLSGLDQVEYPSWKGDKPKLAPPGEGDWLVMEGYMPSYPYNPFGWNHKNTLRAMQVGTSDESRRIGGDDSRKMIQVGADHRFENARFGERYWLWKRENAIDVAVRGNFYYKALIPPGDDQPRGYILMAFGKADKKNEDAFTTVPGGHELDGRLPDGSGMGMGVPVIPELGPEPDGKRDGVILVLHGGWPWEEAPPQEREWGL